MWKGVAWEAHEGRSGESLVEDRAQGMGEEEQKDNLEDLAINCYVMLEVRGWR